MLAFLLTFYSLLACFWLAYLLAFGLLSCLSSCLFFSSRSLRRRKIIIYLLQRHYRVFKKNCQQPLLLLTIYKAKKTSSKEQH